MRSEVALPRIECVMRLLLLLGVVATLLGAGADSGVPVRMVVTAETSKDASKNHDAPAVTAADVTVRQNGSKETRGVAEWIPLQGEHAGLQLAIFIDDGASSDLSLQFGDLRSFILGQPASTQIGVYYMRNGSAIPTQAMTTDHELAAKSLRLPLAQAGIAASPYEALEEFIKKWPATSDRREVLMISSGIDLYRGTPSQNPYLGSAIAKAQRAGVLVHSIYFPGAGHFGHDNFRINFGRDDLSLLGDDTGGEAYWEAAAVRISIKPSLDDLSERLKNQYLLTFLAKPEKKDGFQEIKLRTELHHVELIGADRVWVPVAAAQR